jgi:hypothetical protein
METFDSCIMLLNSILSLKIPCNSMKHNEQNIYMWLNRKYNNSIVIKITLISFFGGICQVD